MFKYQPPFTIQGNIRGLLTPGQWPQIEESIDAFRQGTTGPRYSSGPWSPLPSLLAVLSLPPVVYSPRLPLSELQERRPYWGAKKNVCDVSVAAVAVLRGSWGDLEVEARRHHTILTNLPSHSAQRGYKHAPPLNTHYHIYTLSLSHAHKQTHTYTPVKLQSHHKICL